MFAKRSDAGYRPALDGIERKTLVRGDHTLMTEFRLRQGAVLPRHAYPHEQTGYLVKGSIRLLAAGQHGCRGGGGCTVRRHRLRVRRQEVSATTLGSAVILAVVVVVFSLLLVESFRYAERVIGPRLYEIEAASPP